MFGRKKHKTDSPRAEETPQKGLFRRLGSAIKSSLTYDLKDLFSRHKTIDDELFEEIENLLLSADVGVSATTRIIDNLNARLKRKELNDGDAVFAALRDEMLEILKPVAIPLRIEREATEPFVILLIGINGSGKTTSIGKLSSKFKNLGFDVMLAAGDTFRAAAVEQLQEWGRRGDVPVVAQHTGADSASVIFDALSSARARGTNVLLADTAGRLHTHGGLMEELKKVRRVMSKQQASAPQETLLVIDAGTGQNAVAQAEEFRNEIGVTGLVITKLDGTARGGVVFAIAQKLGIPIRYIGVGEAIDDLREFDAEEFVDALLASRSQ